MPTQPTPVTVATADGPMPAHLWLPAGGSGPGLVVLQEIFGVSDYVRSRCADLAALGYVVLAPELYWRLPQQRVDESRDDFIEVGAALASQLDWDTAVADATVALEELVERPETDGRVGVLGFCFGGGLAFAVAAGADPAVLVSYYGSALPQLLGLAPQVTAPSLHHFATQDTYIPPDQVEQIRTAVDRPQVELRLHEGAGHAFDNPHPAFHHPAASHRAWAITEDWLAAHLPT
ncbi:dienelactone hydrolase family protein [Georgenia sp. 10Sc9-8]|uniref:Dienelactone hydrolase family protein n=1 Tax=Georgenia halotolerans TaxID=3028317 RepID=A0ABT5U2G9_9MICO|nr:dienelactone hydrolase family protein [Georgenia halotolerans]